MSTIKKNVRTRTSLSNNNKSLKANSEAVNSDRNGKKEEETKKSEQKDGKKLPSKTKKPPTTPPSTRITKTQFFPSKNMYSNALKTQEKKAPQSIPLKKPPTNAVKNKEKTTPILRKTEKREKIRSTNNILTKSLSKSESTDESERPRTATLKKGKIVKPPQIELKPPSPEYEDDFESYESDFEAYTSGESATTSQLSDIPSSDSTSSSSKTSPRELKSGTIKRSSSAGTDDERKLDSGTYEMSEAKNKRLLDNIKESIEKENLHLTSFLSDEGFEEAKSLQFINFIEAHKKAKRKQSIEKMNKRGKEILSMIKLDIYSFTLLDIPAVPYEKFIENYGKSNTVQISTQTNEDYIDDDAQTEQIDKENKWTQFPIVIPKFEVPNNEVYRANYLGVGSDDIKDIPIQYNERNLAKFLKNTANLIDNLQVELAINFECTKQTNNLPFSRGCIKYDTNRGSLENKSITFIAFSTSNSNKFLAVHNSKNEESLISLWSILNTTTPDAILGAHGHISCAMFDLYEPNLVFGGLDSGTLLMWDLKETPNIDIKPPIFSTGIKNGHSSKIVSIHPLVDSDPDIFSVQLKEICSLDEEGEILIWGVIPTEKSKDHWSSMVMVINVRISLTLLHPGIGGLQCNELYINPLDSNHLYIATNYGFIFHCLANRAKATVKQLLPKNPSQLNCLEGCPFSPIYLIGGFDDGSISVYSRQIQRPLINFTNKDGDNYKNKINGIQWSQNRPFIFYVKDISNTLHIWDLRESDIFPIYSIPFKDKIVSMKLSTKNNPNEESYLMLATGGGSILIYLLNDKHGPLSEEQYENNVQRFFKYISRYL